MMEFTCDGWVRQGFGFYNPNHAAALICALLPFLWSAWFRWSGRKVRIPVLLGNVLLLAALAATFSRTGLAVLGGELLLPQASEAFPSGGGVSGSGAAVGRGGAAFPGG